ncbi:MAG: Synechococcus phage, partial [Bacteroidota bacterium]
SNSAGTGISYNSTNGVITNSAPDQTVSLTGGTGISTSGSYPNFTITNTAPDQTVSLTGAGTTSISGTYPNFTITSNDQYTGTVTSVGITESSAALSITGSPVTTSGNINIGFAGNSTQYVAGDGSLITFPTIGQASKLITEVYNSTGATLTKGTVVYINGGHGNLPSVTKALATSDATSAQNYGVIQGDITNNNNGYVVVIGALTDLDTSAYSDGTQLYLSSTTAGAYTSTKQYAPAHLVYVGIVTRAHPTQGIIEVKIQNGYELDELHNVSAQSPNNGDILQYNSSSSLWVTAAGTTSSIAEGSNLYYTDARARGAISLTTTGNNGASTYNSTTGVLNVPTYTLAGLGGINLTSLSATTPLAYNNTTGVFSIQQASGSQAGYLSAADWTTFNNKQNALTNPVTGTGTTNYVPKFTGASTIGNSLIWDNGTNVGIGNTNTTYTFDVTGTGRFTSSLLSGNHTISGIDATLTLQGTRGTGGTHTIGASGANNTNLSIVASSAMYLTTNGSDRMIITSSGNIGIGTSSPSAPLSVNGSNVTNANNTTDGSTADLYAAFVRQRGASAGIGGFNYAAQLISATGAEGFEIYTPNAKPLIFGTGATERMRITSSGFTKMSNTGSYYTSTGPNHELRSDVSGDWNTIMTSTASSPYGLLIGLQPSISNTGNEFISAYTGNFSTLRFKFASNGGLYNYQGNDSNLSDARMKNSIIPIESYWDKFKAIEIVKFKYNDQSHDDYNIGVIAQQVEEVAPEFINIDGFGETPEDGIPLKSVYTADLHHATIKVLQEAMTKIEELEAKVSALENKS